MLRSSGPVPVNQSPKETKETTHTKKKERENQRNVTDIEVGNWLDEYECVNERVCANQSVGERSWVALLPRGYQEATKRLPRGYQEGWGWSGLGGGLLSQVAVGGEGNRH